VPGGWKIVKDARAACQIAVPPEWIPFDENSGAAVFHESTTAIAVVTSQPGQQFKPISSPQLIRRFITHFTGFIYLTEIQQSNTNRHSGIP
jgi:hypothetical protein